MIGVAVRYSSYFCDAVYIVDSITTRPQPGPVPLLCSTTQLLHPLRCSSCAMRITTHPPRRSSCAMKTNARSMWQTNHRLTHNGASSSCPSAARRYAPSDSCGEKEQVRAGRNAVAVADALVASSVEAEGPG